MMFRHANSRGDTIIEVMLAMGLLTAFLFISWGITNKSTQIGMNARKRTEVVNAMKEQAEVIKAIYVRSDSDIKSIIDQVGPTATTLIEKRSCDSDIGVAEGSGGTTFYYTEEGGVIKKVHEKKGVPDDDNAVWVQYKEGPLSDGPGTPPEYYDFYIRACWQTVGSAQGTDNAQFIVRLNTNLETEAGITPGDIVSSGTATLAYEDIYPGPGDYDFNDFIVNLRVTESYDDADNLEGIVIEYYPEKHMTAFTNSFHLTFDGRARSGQLDAAAQAITGFESTPMFAGNANITYELFNRGVDTPVTRIENVPKNQNLTIFENTANVVETPNPADEYNQQYTQWARVTITNFDTPNPKRDFSIKRYRSLLRVRQLDPSVSSYYDIDLGDINCNMFDGANIPLAVFVPVDWEAPRSTQDINDIYPNFQYHAKYLHDNCNNPNPPAEQSPPNGGLHWYNK